MALLLAVLASAHLARAGTATARTLAAAAIAGLLLAWTVRTVVVVVSGRDIVRTARRVAGKVDRELAERIARALRLATTTARGGDPVSHGLALLHADGLVARVGQQRLVERAAASARRFRVAALVLAVASMAILLVGPLRVVEGLDVLAARKGRAPLPIDWVDELTGEVQVPRYLRQDNGSFMGFGRTRQPRGSVLTLRAGVLHADRRLVLTDGATEVPFVDDAHGAVVARWTLGDSVKLEVAARFGDVLIVQNESLEVESLADEAPKVEVQGAPRTVRLLDVTEVEVNYEVADDHGLSQVDLVLRAGAKEERRSLAKLDGQELFQRGSAVVRPNDRFIK
jgi:hypothetical protein